MVVVVVVVAMGAALGGAGCVAAGVAAGSLGPQVARRAALSKATQARRWCVLMPGRTRVALGQRERVSQEAFSASPLRPIQGLDSIKLQRPVQPNRGRSLPRNEERSCQIGATRISVGSMELRTGTLNRRSPL